MNEEIMAQMQGGGQGAPVDVATQNAQMLQEIGQMVAENNQMLQEIGQMIAEAMGGGQAEAEAVGMQEGAAMQGAADEEAMLREEAMARLAQQQG